LPNAIDIKPSNVIVAPYDGKPVVKVIDFGVAKATGQKLTERTMFTEVGQIVGTLEYMAPEQAELNNLDIDTRADIYSLGASPPALRGRWAKGPSPLTLGRADRPGTVPAVLGRRFFLPRDTGLAPPGRTRRRGRGLTE
jgi:serine/threonine protein kinase